MSIYYSKQIPGQLWLRDLNDNVSSAYDVLSSVYIKYKNINPSFFFDLSSYNMCCVNVDFIIILLKNINLVYTSSTNWDEAQNIFGLENPKIT